MPASQALLDAILATLPAGPPGVRPRGVVKSIEPQWWQPKTVRQALGALVREGLAACAGPMGGRRYWRAELGDRVGDGRGSET